MNDKSQYQTSLAALWPSQSCSDSGEMEVEVRQYYCHTGNRYVSSICIEYSLTWNNM